MNLITKVAGTLRDAANHPLNRHRKLKTALEYGLVQVVIRFVPGEICVKFLNHAHPLAGTGARNIFYVRDAGDTSGISSGAPPFGLAI